MRRVRVGTGDGQGPGGLGAGFGWRGPAPAPGRPRSAPAVPPAPAAGSRSGPAARGPGRSRSAGPGAGRAGCPRPAAARPGWRPGPSPRLGSSRSCTGGSTTSADDDWTKVPWASADRAPSRIVTVKARLASSPGAGDGARSCSCADPLPCGGMSSTGGVNAKPTASSGSAPPRVTLVGLLPPRFSTVTLAAPVPASRTRITCGSRRIIRVPSRMGTDHRDQRGDLDLRMAGGPDPQRHPDLLGRDHRARREREHHPDGLLGARQQPHLGADDGEPRRPGRHVGECSRRRCPNGCRPAPTPRPDHRWAALRRRSG